MRTDWGSSDKNTETCSTQFWEKWFKSNLASPLKCCQYKSQVQKNNENNMVPK